ncbi:replicative DNA helicase [Planctomycetales bacterium ZRK34]|nr:replicative DNA helicase [Planctomycetales bacterium ZRK34]
MSTTTARKRRNFEAERIEVGKLLDKLPPHSLEAEMSLLGSLIVAGTENVHLIGEAMQILRGASDFYQPRHAEIYQSIIDLYDRHQAVDLVQLVQRLRDRQQEESVGGVDYLVELAESVPTAVNVVHYARIVRDKAKVRHLINAAGTILHQAYDSDEPPNHLVDQAEKMIFDIAQDASADEPTALAELVQMTFEQLEARRDSGTTFMGVPTGYYLLDEYLGGLQRGDMLILAARPSMGKTALALNIAENIAVQSGGQGRPVAVFSIEMGKQQLADRLLSSYSGVDSQKMRRNMLSADDLHRLQEAASDLTAAPVFIDDTPGLSVLQLRAKARRLAARHDIEVIIIDYLQLMTSPGAESRQVEVSEISRGVKALARELKVPVICLSQLNRNPEGRESKRPMLSDLRESGSIEQDADVVMMLHRESYYHKGDEEWAADHPHGENEAELIIAKQRNGPTGLVPLHFNGNTTRFENPAHRSYGEFE